MKLQPWMLTGLLFLQASYALRPRSLKRSLDSRQSCSSGYKICGDYCIPSSYTCCPDLQGGCPASDYCTLGDNGEYGCCEDGEICTGDGGVSTIDTYSSTSTSTYYDDSTITSYSVRTTTSTDDDEGLSWRTYTATYDDGDRQVFSYAIYEGGYISNSAELEWTTRTITEDDGDRTVYTIASNIPPPLEFTETYVEYTTTRDWALYNGGYVTNSDELDWDTTTYTLSDGDVTVATFASYPDSETSTTRRSSTSSRSTSTSSSRSTSTSSRASTTAVASTAANTGQSTVIATSGSNHATRIGASVLRPLSNTALPIWSAVVAGLMFIAMIWL